MFLRPHLASFHTRKTSIETTRGRQGDIRDSGYYRLFQSQKTDSGYDEIAQRLARIVSKIHSASICNGNKLEEYIGSSVYNTNSPTKNHAVISLPEIQKGHYMKILFDKGLWGENKKEQSTEIDYMLYDEQNRICLFEIKDGDAFDTKKSREEIKSIRDVSILLKDHMPDASIKCYVVLWNIKDLKKNNFKASLDEGISLINGRMMCDIIGNIDYDTIIHSRKEIGDRNLDFCIHEMREIVRTYDEIYKKQNSDVDALAEMLNKDATIVGTSDQ